MIKSFRDKETEKVFHREYSKKIPSGIQHQARRKLIMIDALPEIMVLPDLAYLLGHYKRITFFYGLHPRGSRIRGFKGSRVRPWPFAAGSHPIIGQEPTAIFNTLIVSSPRRPGTQRSFSAIKLSALDVNRVRHDGFSY